MATESGASSPGVSVPKGGGATRGLGDGFTPDFNRGTGSYSIEIQVPRGHRDLVPNIALAYNSAAGDGPFGFGWNIALPRIQIDTDAGVADYLAPAFLFGGESLLAMPDGTFRPQVENAFHRVRRSGDGWEVTDRSGNVTSYGTSAGSRISGEIGGVTRDFAWLPELMRDTSGNELCYEYLRDEGNLFVALIAYARFEVRFEYGERHDVTVNRRAGFAIATRLRCTAIEVRRPDRPEPRIRRYALAYHPETDAPSRLSEVSLQGFMRRPDGTTATSIAPPARFTYTPFDPRDRRFQVVGAETLGDAGPLGEHGTALVDLTGDGLPDIVKIAAGPPRMWRNLGDGTFASPRTLADLPTSVGLTADRVALFDADGEGSADLVYLRDGGAHYYENAGSGRFGPPRYLGGNAPLSLNLADPNTRFADVDGDGRIDLAQTTSRGVVTWRNLGGSAGFAPPTVTTRTRDRDASPDVTFSEPGVFFADMTGDGLPDLVHVRSGMVEYWPSLGGGRFDTRVSMADPPQLPRHHDPRRLFVADIDGSGTADIVYVGDDRVLVWRNVAGRRFAAPIEVAGVPGTAAASVRLVDLLGHGTAGVLWSNVATARGRGYRFLSLAPAKPYLLTLVDEGVGLRTQIDYGTSARHAAADAREGTPWRTRLPMVVNVVNRITREDLVSGAQQATEMRYHDGSWDPSVRRFRGFGRVTARRSDAPDAPASFEEHRYLVGAPDEPGFGPGAPEGTERARRGQGYESAYFSSEPGSPLIRAETTSWKAVALGQTVTGRAILFPQVASTEVRNIEGGTHPRVIVTTYTYDSFGNVTEERRHGTAPDGDDRGQPVEALEVVTRMEYAINLSRHIVDRVARTLRVDAGGGLLAEVRQYYDGPEAVGLPLGQVERGLLSRQEEATLPLVLADAIYGAGTVDWPALGYHQIVRADGVASWAVNRSRLTHSPAGMMTSRTDARGGTCRYGYDDDGLLLTSVTNELGQVASATYDPAWQLVEERVDINAARTRYVYDPRGRLERVIRPGDSDEFPTLRYTRVDDVLPLSVRTERRRRSGTAETYEKITYFDGFGRALQTRSRVDGEQVRVTGTVGYNRNGDAVSKGLPLFRQGLGFEATTALPVTPRFTYRYDSVGRVISAVNLEGREMRVVYTPWTASTFDVIDTDPSHPHRDTPEVRHFDAFGRLVGVSAMSAPATTHRASYQYDLLGRLVATTDLEGRPAIVSSTYDARGARLRIVHAAAGERTMVFDALGRVVSYRDGRNIVVQRQHDALGRLLTESVAGEIQERYHWDVTPAQLGLLGRVEDRGGQVAFDYDAQGRVIEKRRQIGETEYRLAYTYDAAGFQASQIYPDGAEVGITRWGDGRVRALDGFVADAAYDSSGLLVALRHANGVEEGFTYDAAGTLNEMRVARGSEMLRRSTLTHDAVGRLVANEEAVGPHAGLETAEFDARGRLVRFTRDQSAAGGALQSHVYAYDGDGNLLRADEMAAASFEYDVTAPGALRRRTRPDGTTEEFSFDAAGNLASTAEMQLTFDGRGRLARVVRTDGTTVEMTYDYRGARLSKRVTSPAGNYDVRYVDDLYEDHAGVVTAYTYLSGRLVGQRRGSGVRHLHADHRANVILATRSSGEVDARAWMGPYGLGQTMDASDISRQFGSCVLDGETGLYYFNHRYYSPALGRFTSPDPRFLGQPERELDLPEAHNLYAYAKGDPLDYVDPTGKGFWSTFGKVLAAIVVVAAVIVAVVVAVAVIAAAMAAGGWAIVLGATVLGAIIGGIQGGWEGALMGSMIGFTAGINMSIAGPLGIITFLGVFDGIRSQGWYKSLAGWTSWFMPASWPGHILGLGVFLGNGIAHVFGSDKQIESVKFDWSHGQILTAGGEYGGSPFPWLGIEAAPAHNVGGFSFFTNDLWTASGESWSGMEDTVEHETGHMLSNAIFGFWQGIVNGIENFTTDDHNDRFFEKIAESNVNEGDRADYGRDVPVWS